MVIIKARKSRSGTIWMQYPLDSIHWKVEVNGEDITSNLLEYEWEKPVNENVGNFKINFAKYDSDLLAYRGNVINIYEDLVDATKLVFSGIVENPKDNTDGTITLEGLYVSGDLMQINVTAEHDDILCSTILEDIIDRYATGFTKGTINVTTEKMSVKWEGKPFFDCIADIVNKCGFVLRISPLKVINFFERGSELCTEDALVYEQNYIASKGLGFSDTMLKDKITVEGSNDGIPIIYTKGTGTKELLIKDDTLKTYGEVKSRAQAEYLNGLIPAITGSGEGIGFFYINEGEKMRVTIPPKTIHDWYFISSMKRRFPGFTMEMELEKRVRGIAKYLRATRKTQIETQQLKNKNEMKFTHIRDMNNGFLAGDSYSNVEIVNGVLKLQSGMSSGYLITENFTLDENVTQGEIRASGESLETLVYLMTNDNGRNWNSCNLNELTNYIESGDDIKVKITFSSNERLRVIGLLGK